MQRSLKPRAPVVIRAAHVSQLTCEAVLGIDPRRYLELLVPKCAHVSSVGKLRVVSVDDADEALRSLSAPSVGAPSAVDGAEDDEDEGPATADEFLAQLGRRRSA